MHKCTLSPAERMEKLECPLCQKKEKDMKRQSLFQHVEQCEKLMEKLKSGCPQCGKTFETKERYGNSV